MAFSISAILPTDLYLSFLDMQYALNSDGCFVKINFKLYVVDK